MLMLKIGKDLFDLLYPIGIYVETSNANWTPQSAGWYGTWTREDDGTTLVSYKSSGAFNKPIESTTGEETHKLTEAEMPKHNHSSANGKPVLEDTGSADNQFGWHVQEASGYRANGAWLSNKGGDQAHNNIQPSKIVYRWHRTA